MGLIDCGWVMRMVDIEYFTRIAFIHQGDHITDILPKSGFY